MRLVISIYLLLLLLLSMTSKWPAIEMGFNVLVECSQYLISASYRVADNGAGDEDLSL